MPSPRPNRSRPRRLLTAAAAFTLVASVFVGFASGFWHYECRWWDGNGFSCRYFSIARGRIEAGRTDLFRVMDAGPAESLKYQPEVSWRWRWRRWADRPMVFFRPYWAAPDMNLDWIVSIPLWIPGVLSAAVLVPPVLRTARRRRRFKAGRCPRCGYDLAGLAPAAVCPECGRSPAE